MSACGGQRYAQKYLWSLMLNAEIVMSSVQLQETQNWAFDRYDRHMNLFATMHLAALKLIMRLKPSKITNAILKVLERTALYKVDPYPITNNVTFHSLHVFQMGVSKHIHCTSFYNLKMLKIVFMLFDFMWRKSKGTHSRRGRDLKKNNPNYNFKHFLLESRTAPYLPRQN